MIPHSKHPGKAATEATVALGKASYQAQPFLGNVVQVSIHIKNTSLAFEASELLAEFQWLTPEQSADLTPVQREAVAEEMADVLIYLCRLADVSGIDLLPAAAAKLASNRARYTVEAAKGNAEKVQRNRTR